DPASLARPSAKSAGSSPQTPPQKPWNFLGAWHGVGASANRPELESLAMNMVALNRIAAQPHAEPHANAMPPAVHDRIHAALVAMQAALERTSVHSRRIRDFAEIKTQLLRHLNEAASDEGPFELKAEVSDALELLTLLLQTLSRDAGSGTKTQTMLARLQ